MGKPRPGVCGTCGHAVVQPMKKKPGWCEPPHGAHRSWENMLDYGHFFEADLSLKRVRCEDCARREKAGG